MIGVLMCISLIFSHENNFRHISFSLDNNDIYELNKEKVRAGGIDGVNYHVGIPIDLRHGDYKYIRARFEGIKDEKVAMGIRVGNLNENDILIQSQLIPDESVHNGDNDYELNVQDISYIEIYVSGTEDVVLSSIQFRESLDGIHIKDALPYLITYVLVYILLSVAIVLLITKKSTRSYISDCGISETRSITDVPKTPYFLFYIAGRLFRIFLFGTVTFISFVLQMKVGEKGYRDHFHEYLAIQLIILIVLVLFIIGKDYRIEKKRVDNAAFLTCLAIALYTLISDCAVDKVYRYSGIALFIVLGVYAYSWLVKKHNTTYTKDFEYSVQVFLIILLISSVVIPDNVDDGRFAGPLTNPSIFAIYLGGVWAVLMGSMENHILNNSRLIVKALTIIEMIITVVLAFMSQSITPMLAMITVTAICIFRLLSKSKGVRYAIRLFVISTSVGLVILAGLAWYMRNNDVNINFRLLEKLGSSGITSFLSSRNYYWKTYLRKMNLLGHGRKPFLWDHRILPHNAIISVMYWYGVPCVIPYVLMMIMAVDKSWRYANTGLKYAAVPFYSIVSFVIMSMADNVEQPFVWLPWIACYLMMAPILIMPVEEIEALKSADADIYTEESEQI